MNIKFKNNAKSTLASGINTTDTSLTLVAGGGVMFPALTGVEYFYLTIIDQATYGTDSEVFEIVKVTAVTGDVLTIERAVDNSTARAAIADDVIELRVTNQVLLDIGGKEAPSSRNYIDKFFISMYQRVLFANVTEFKKANYRYAPYLLDNWDADLNSKMKIVIEDKTNHVIYDNLTFATIGDMITWRDNNVAIVAGYTQATCVAKVYEEIDETIPVMTTMYAMNRLYSSAKGRRMYKGQGYTARASNNLDTFVPLVNHFLGTAFDGSEAGFGDLIWLSRARKNMYAIPPFKSSKAYKVDMTSSSMPRRVYDGSNIVNSTTEIYENETDSVFLSINLSNSEDIFFTWMDAYDAIKKGSSVCICAKINGDGTGNSAIALKPVGIDMIVMDLPDDTLYDLEVVYFNGQRQHFVKTQTINIPALGSEEKDVDGSKLRLTSDKWMSLKLNSSEEREMMNVNTLGWDKVFFRLRDKATKKVGKLSYVYVEMEKLGSHKSYAHRMMLKSSKK